MRVVILAGGRGTRLVEETVSKPKPMVSVGKMPMLWHIMSIFAQFDYRNFVIASGYMSQIIESWVRDANLEWDIEVLDTGQDTQTGGRIKRVMDKFPEERFFATYGDGVGNINIERLIEFHNESNCLATVTAVRPPARFGYLELDGEIVSKFGEKSQAQSGWINGGFFVLEPAVKQYIYSESEPFETGALPRLTESHRLAAYKHQGFWHPMDTLREKLDLEDIHAKGKAPWLNIKRSSRSHH